MRRPLYYTITGYFLFFLGIVYAVADLFEYYNGIDEPWKPPVALLLLVVAGLCLRVRENI